MQAAQAVAPADPEYPPATQGVQLAAPAAEDQPAAQGTQAVTPVALA